MGWTYTVAETEERGEGLRLAGAPALQHVPMGQYPVMVLRVRFSNNAETAMPTRAQIQTLYNRERGLSPAVLLVMDVGMGVAVMLHVTATVMPWIDLPHPVAHYALDL